MPYLAIILAIFIIIFIGWKLRQFWRNLNQFLAILYDD
jgi:hypothetical protein